MREHSGCWLVHAWVLARSIGQALDFICALKSDTEDVGGGTSAEEIHLAAMAGSIDLLQRRFAGIELWSETLWINAYWPPELGSLELGIVYPAQPGD